MYNSPFQTVSHFPDNKHTKLITRHEIAHNSFQTDQIIKFIF